MSLPNHSSEGLCEHFSKLAITELDGAMIEATIAQAVTQKMFGRCNDSLVQVSSCRPPNCVICICLQTAHVGNTECSSQNWIFAVGLFDSTPPGVARNVQHGCKGLSRSHGQHLATNVRRDLANQLWIPSCSKADCLRKLHSISSAETSHCLFMDYGGNPESRLASQPLLDLIMQCCDALGS